MDTQSSGTESAMISTTVSKPRPPPPSKKPKPSVPKKPPVAAKPMLEPKPVALETKPVTLEPKPVIQNGGLAPANPALDCPEPAFPESISPQTSDDHSSPTSLPRTIMARPKEPPPPLPKVAPSKATPPHLRKMSKDGTQPLSERSPPKDPPPPLPKTSPSPSPKPVKRGPSVTKTPPPLPKTPARGSVKRPLLNSSRQGSLDSPERQNTLDLKSSVDHSTAEENALSQNNKDTLNAIVNTNKRICDTEKTEITDKVATNTNLKSRFTGLSENVSTPSVRKVPLKPKPRILEKSKAVTELDEHSLADDQLRNNNNKTKGRVSNSTWFVDTDETNTAGVKNDSKSETVNGNTNAEIEIISNKNEMHQSSIKFKKVDSPSHSPIAPRKPLPKLPTKAKPFILSTENVNTAKGSDDTKELPTPGDKHVVLTDSEQTFQGAICANNNSQVGDLSARKERLNDNVFIAESTTSYQKPDSSASPPKPIQRKPVPAIRPRPTPRKRPSLSQSAETDESAESTKPVIQHSPKTFEASTSGGKTLEKSDFDSAETVSRRPKGEQSNLDNVGDQIKGEDSDTNGLKSRVVTTATGEEEEYRVIDRAVRTKSHITELDDHHHDDDNTVILRKRVSRDNQFDIQDVPSVEELKSIFHSDEEDTQENVPKECLSKDFGFGDKFLTFSNKDDENLVTNSVENKTNKKSDDSESVKDLLADKSILEPTSLLNEIEDILTRSYNYKRSSLTRSGSSPEKKSNPYLRVNELSRTERSRSVDTSSSSPVRPPRPKKEQRRLRSRSTIGSYDSCGSDTESLPDLSRGRLDSQGSNLSMTLGKAKPHPPKPKRHKLLKVQRSQSDITAMKSVVDNMESGDTKSPKQRRQLKSESGHESLNDNEINLTNSKPETPQTKGADLNGPVRRNRPSRKAPPPPPGAPCKITPPPRSSSVNLDIVMPVDERVKSMNLNSSANSPDLKDSKKGGKTLKDTSGYYHSIKDDDIDSSDCDHDYQDIPDEKEQHVKPSKFKNIMEQPQGKSSVRMGSPPKLPPRNMNNSHSFDNSSLSSAGQEFDSVITGGASSTEDMSISSGCFENDIHSPGFKNQHLLKMYPKTSSPYVKDKHHSQTGSEDNALSSGLGPSISSLSSCGDEKTRRPVSECSIQSDSWSESHEAGQSTSSDSEMDEEEKVCRKKEKKLFMIAQEVAKSERVFVDVLRLLNVDFRKYISTATEKAGRPVIPNDVLNRILDYLPQLQNFNEELLADLEDRISHWEEKKCIADIFRKKGPFLKLFSSYILNFETITTTLDEALKKYPAFQAAVKEFELSPRCACLAIKHYMLKPIQRIPQYRLLLQDYMNHLPPDSPEVKDMQTALAIVSDVAFHANENMRHEDYVQKMLEIQRSLIGQFEVIRPGRLFLKEGELKKLSRKELQPRYFFMFNDVLLYTTPVATGYKLNNVLPLAGMKVSVSAHDEYKMDFSIISVQRSFTLQGSTLEEREDWVTALEAAIEENALKRNTFEAVRSQSMLDKDFVLGHKAPLWIPDARVTMCMICTCEFTVTFRRHHCRACGWVVCSNCSENKAELRYLKHKLARVCDKCFKVLVTDKGKEIEESTEKGDNSSLKDEDGGGGSGLLTVTAGVTGLFERLGKIRRSGQRDKKHIQVRPERLKEVSANDEGASMSGYLQKWRKGKKWKKQWFLIKDKVLFTFKATQDRAATSSMVLLGYEVHRFTDMGHSDERIHSRLRLFPMCRQQRDNHLRLVPCVPSTA